MNLPTIKHEFLSGKPPIVTKIRQIILFGFLFFTSVMTISCQENGKSQNLSADGTRPQAPADSLHKPHVNITVNRRYDNKGNLIGSDSTYTSYYSNIEGDTLMMDSLFEDFDRYFDRNRSSFLNRDLDDLFFRDSLRYNDFFHDDFFMRRYELNDEYLRNMMRQMDSIKNDYFKKHRSHRESADL